MITSTPPCIARTLEIARSLYGALPYQTFVPEEGGLELSLINPTGGYVLKWEFDHKTLQLPNEYLEAWMCNNVQEITK